MPYRLDDKMSAVSRRTSKRVDVPNVDEVIFEQHATLSPVSELMLLADEALCCFRLDHRLILASESVR